MNQMPAAESQNAQVGRKHVEISAARAGDTTSRLQPTKTACEGGQLGCACSSRFTCRKRFDCLSRWAAAAAGDCRTNSP